MLLSLGIKYDLRRVFLDVVKGWADIVTINKYKYKLTFLNLTSLLEYNCFTILC